jgi:hypothetical protein
MQNENVLEGSFRTKELKIRKIEGKCLEGSCFVGKRYCRNIG